MYHIHAAARCRQLDPRLCQERHEKPEVVESF